ncbi:MAG: hypothetical protein ACK5B9_03640 [Flavobacteriia bacterium]|jgi:hypothetical protein
MQGIPNIVFILIFVYFVFFRKKEDSNDLSDNNAVDLKDHYEKNDEVKKLQSAGLTRSYSYQTYINMCDKLQSWMTGAGTSNEEEIVKIMKMVKNDLDFLILYDTFGIREGSMWSSGDLKEWLRDDLSEYWITNINNNYKSKGMLKRI